MKKTYIEPATKIATPVLAAFMAASNPTADLDNGTNGGFKDNEIDVDNGEDESGAKGNTWSSWDD